MAGAGPIEAAFFDADGTLLSFRTHEVPASARRALVALRDAGVRTFLCTGRSPSLLSDVPVELFDACLTMSGQYCYLADGTLLHARPIAPSDIEVVVDQVRSGLYNCLFMEPQTSFLSGHDRLVDRAFAEANVHAEVRDAREALERDIYQLNVFLPADAMGVVERATRGLRFARWSPNFADAMPAGGGKAVGVGKALEWFGISADRAIAFGDGGNDADMFAAVATSVAMGGASDEVKVLATHVTEDVDDDGVWNACVRLGLVDA